MLSYSMPLVPNNIMWWLVSALNRPVMEIYLGMEAIGLFAVANKFPCFFQCVCYVCSFMANIGDGRIWKRWL